MSITDEDRKKIAQLRELVKDKISPYYDTDFNLLRWLQGHDYNLKIIKPKLENHLFLRQWDWKLDAMAKDTEVDPIQEHWRNALTGESKVFENVIVNLEQTGMNDWWGMLHTHPMNKVLKSRIRDLELMLAKVMEVEEKTGKQAHIMYVMDLGGLAWDAKLPALLKGPLSALSSFMADHYVELIHSFVLVNVPLFISSVWNIAHPLLPERTKKKVVILGSNWKEEITKYAQPEILPTFWNVEGENKPFKYEMERCIPYPEIGYYTQKPSNDAKILSIAAGKTDSIDIFIDENEDVSWELHSDGTFQMSIFYVDDPRETKLDAMERVMPNLAKVPGPTLHPIADQMTCHKPGLYRFHFSNEPAWWYSVKITHLIQRLPRK